MLTRPFRFMPILKRTMWGGARLLALKGCKPMAQGVGESWEISGLRSWESVVADGPDKGLTITQLIARHGEALMGKGPYRRLGGKFPLLIKFLDAGHDLSVQVHPDERMAAEDPACNVKNETWYVIDSYPGSKIYLGFNRAMDPAEFDRRVADSSIMECITAHESAPGKLFNVPSGTIHALGAGNFVVEIQGCSDDTYRVYDFDRTDVNGQPRLLHLDQARRALDFSQFDNDESLRRGLRIDGELIDINVHDINGSESISLPADSFTVLISLKGRQRITYASEDFTLTQGSTVLLPADVTAINTTGRGELMTVALHDNPAV